MNLLHEGGSKTSTKMHSYSNWYYSLTCIRWFVFLLVISIHCCFAIVWMWIMPKTNVEISRTVHRHCNSYWKMLNFKWEKYRQMWEWKVNRLYLGFRSYLLHGPNVIRWWVGPSIMNMAYFCFWFSSNL